MRNRAALMAVAMLLGTGHASAQEARPAAIAIDTAASVDETVDPNGNHVSGMFVDSVVSVGLGHGLETIVRPYVQRLPTGEWNRQIWLATMRYERAGRVGLRIDGGLIPAPVGLANMQLRPQLNPVVSQPSSLFTPLPALETRGPRTMLLGAVYPWGANATVSGRKWDARVAVIDTSPLRARRIFAEGNNPPRFTNVVLGGGVSPIFGLRVGASVTRGGWMRAGEVPAVTSDQRATIVTVESEYSVRYTKVSGEWTHDTIETSHGTASPAGWFVQGQQTLTPRWFAAARVEQMSAPAFNDVTGIDALRFNGTEEIVGFRLTPEITVRAGHRARDAFNGSSYVHAGTLSIVWWRRWS